MDKYMKVRQIGEGAFGKAILVRPKQGPQGSQLVIKEISISRMSAKEREEARKEVAVLAQLAHPNIVTYRDSFEERGSLFIVMDFCSGGDMYSRISTQRGLLFPEDKVLDWFCQICLAIKHIHDRKILHRDIKSQNIFLDSQGMVKLGDFGIAKILNSTSELARTCIGTPYYLSPEIVENKPYNNKSDIWSLGCVLYELTTLKHAFEAGNMKNLVLKIIRGSYPAIPPQYSYDLRGLIAQLFKRNPKDRPSINSVLRKNFIISRARKFLSDEKMADEFSHTVMHGKKIARALPAGPKPSNRPTSANRRPLPQPAGRYDPSAIYGAPVRKSANRPPSAGGKRPGSASGSRPGSAAGSRPNSARGNRPGATPAELEKKRQEMLEKDRKRREEEKKRQEEKFAQKHKEFVDRQKMARINKAREEGWKNLVRDPVPVDPEQQKAQDKEFKRPLPVPQIPLKRAVPDRGKYDDYLAKLDRMAEQGRQARGGNDNSPRSPGGGGGGGGGGIIIHAGGSPAVPKPQKEEFNRAVPQVNTRPMAGNDFLLQQALRQAEYNRQKADEASERARIVEEFMMRKREAALNKIRGQHDIYGRKSPFPSPATPVPAPRASGGSGGGRRQEEQEYLEKLRHIREQNIRERRALMAKHKGVPEPDEEELRRKKIEALKKQADYWAEQQKEQERMEMIERQKAVEARMQERDAAKAKAMVAAKAAAAPAVPITGALHAIGASEVKTPSPTPDSKRGLTPAPAIPITGALGAIGAKREEQPASRPETPSKEEVQQKKKDILNRLNSPVGNRGKWGAPASPLAAAPEDEEPSSARSQWGEVEGGTRLGILPLEQTASQMEATGKQDVVVPVGGKGGAKAGVAAGVMVGRHQWKGPGNTVLSVLQGLPVAEGTTILESGEETSPPGAGPNLTSAPSPQGGLPAGRGSTITIEPAMPAPPVRSGTIVLKSVEETVGNAAEPGASPTPTPAATEGAGDATDGKELKPLGKATPEHRRSPAPKVVTIQEEPGKEEEEGKEKDKKDSSVKVGLTTGHFDMKNVSLLRTCSEPDLTKLTHTATPCPRPPTRHGSLESCNEDDEEDEELMALQDLNDDNDDDDKEDGEEEDQGDDLAANDGDDEEEELIFNDDEDDDEDAAAVEETMRSLLCDDEEGGDGDAKESSRGKVVPFRLDSSEDSDKEKTAVERNDENDDTQAGNGDDDNNATNDDLFQTDSDTETQFGDDDDMEEYDLFSRLEQKRAELEAELGLEKFCEVYRTIQALQEDEDENIEDGARIAIKLLGKKHEHLYPRIFQLVMADTAFTEDNT